MIRSWIHELKLAGYDVGLPTLEEKAKLVYPITVYVRDRESGYRATFWWSSQEDAWILSGFDGLVGYKSIEALIEALSESLHG